MKDPLISVIIPSYNHCLFIKNAIESVIKQTYLNWELIVVDNNSTDNTNKILNEFRQHNLNVIKVTNNGVIAISRNIGIKASKGNWIAFLDSDDSWKENKLEICVKEMKSGIDLIYHDLIIHDLNYRFYKKKKLKGRFLSNPPIIDLLCHGNCIYNSSVIVKKYILEEIGYISIDNKMIACEDYNTWLKLSYLSNGFKYIPKSLGYYTIHDNGISRKNMSIPMHNATIEFVKTLSESQKKKYKANLEYANCRFRHNNSFDNSVQINLLFCVWYGNYEIRMKSIYMLFVELLIYPFNFLNNFKRH